MSHMKNAVYFLIITLFTLSSCRENNSETAEKDPENETTSEKEAEYRITGERHFIDGYPPLNQDSLMHVIVEIPTGSIEKWEVEKKSGHLALEKRGGELRRVDYLGYPGNYGMVPQTLLKVEDGGDGDPLDVLILGEPLERGSLVAVKLIGVLKLLDRNEQDDKLIAVVEGSPFFELNDLDELNFEFKGVTSIIETWFNSYKGGNKIEIIGFENKNKAEEILNAGINGYKNK
ncbi:inorganic diphosphatase [Salegentibacter sp. Hel_I_6]|uniref:inorganic diphosphatase n=1 Tax=Salegentibacter sp. Hel_I_6 TaxID=1250278 RepID=UPI0009DD4D05|nr:inorganic diphosphatase [Salegentibacter sp. Hel_I_6]